MNILHTYVSNLLWAAIPFVIGWGLLALSMHRDRSRYRNCYLLMLAVFLSLPLMLGLAGRWSFLVGTILLVLFFLAVLIIPGLLVGNGITMLRKEGHSLKNLLSLLLGLGIGLGELCTILLCLMPILELYTDVHLHIYNGHIPRVMLLIGLSVLYFSVNFLAFLFYTLFLEIIPRKRDFDFVIIHGAGLLQGDRVSKLLADRLDKAIDVYHKDPTPPILIPSGGKGSDESVSEAEAMANYLLDHGIPADHILQENTSRTTMENLVNSKALIEAQPEPRYTALVTSNYHVYRALRYCRKIGLHCTGIGSHVARYYWPSAMIREYIAVHSEKKHLIFLLLGWFLLVLLPFGMLFLR